MNNGVAFDCLIKCDPCPFCGSTAHTMSDTGYGIYVGCGRESCGATGPVRKSERGAYRAWNKRRSVSSDAAP